MTTDFSDAEKRELRDWAVARGSGHHRRECPACSFGRSPSNRKIQCLSVEIDADKAVFFCWHCSAKGAVRLQEMNHVAREPKPEVSKAVKAMTGPLDPVYAFLKTRGISKETAEVFNIHAASAFFPDLRRTTPAIGYPYKAAGKAAGSKLRSLEEKAHVCSKPLHSLFAGDLVDLEEGDYLIIAEGELDALSFFEAGIVNATSVPNGAQSFSAKDDKTFLWANKDIIEKVSKVYIASDSDEPGEKLAEELARRIGRHRCWRIEYPDGCKDANDVLMKLGGETLKGCFENAKPWPISGLYEADRYFVELDEIYDNGYGGRISTGLDAVDKLYSLAPGRLCIVTGIPNHGKTTFVNQLIVNAARLYGIKTAICSFETPPATHLGTMAEILVQKHFVEKENVAGVRMSKRELHSTYKFSLENFKFLQQDDGAKATVESLIERIKTAVFRWGVRAVVIDPYNYIQREASFESETQFIDDLLTRLRLTAVAYDLHIWFIAHTTKMQQNQDGSYQIPGGYHISGSGAWYAKADFGLTVYQVHDDPGTVKVVLWKVRFAWEGMKGEVKIMYDTSRNVYISNPNTDLGPWEADDDF